MGLSRPPLFLEPADFVRDAASMESGWSREDSLHYTRWLATRHYENFPVVSLLLPKDLHQDFYNVYAFCRWADDLGDEIGNAEESLRLLRWWRELLESSAPARHPVYVALRETIARRRLPLDCFHNLITAFERDQTVTRYANWDEVLDYCVYSANPVGRLVLALCGYHDEDRARLSDFTCSGLQLANFWQDVRVDVGKGRIYLPQDLLARHGVTEASILSLQQSEAFAAALREAVDFARLLFQQGLALIPTLDARLALDIELFSRGGMAILDKIEAKRYQVLVERPKLSRWNKAALLLKALTSWGRNRIVSAVPML
jgi:squalene synthase HpnC